MRSMADSWSRHFARLSCPRKRGIQRSSVPHSKRRLDHPLSPMMTAVLASHSLRIKHRLLAGAVAFQRAFFANRIGALEDPVLPSGQTGENLGFHGFRATEPQVRLETSETVG